jgi:hypothetical protein
MVAGAILPEIAVPGRGELVERYKKGMREAERADMLPYAELLGGCILRQMKAKREKLLAGLKSAPWNDMCVPIFSWNTVEYREKLEQMKSRCSAMTAEELAAHNKLVDERKSQIAAADGEHMFGVAQTKRFGCDIAMREVRIDRIFKNSDLATLLVTSLGPGFSWRITRTSERPAHVDAWSPYGYWFTTKTLYAVYHPKGLPKAKLLKNIQVFRDHSDRMDRDEIAKLAPYMWLRGSGNWKTDQPEEMLMPKYEYAPGRWSTEEPDAYTEALEKAATWDAEGDAPTWPADADADAGAYNEWGY